MSNPSRDVAVVGMSGKFPGADSIAEYWRNLCAGTESIAALSEDQLRRAGVSDSDIQDSTYVKSAALLNGVELFDPAFFKISPLEAELMDPQIRLLLQCAWEALEDAGHASKGPQNIGVFAGAGGVTTSYFANFVNVSDRFEKVTAGPTHLGNDKDFVATYISYKLNLTGPSVTVQTACSTSLVALHQARQSLLSGECEMALAGGVTVRVPHGLGYHYREGYIFSKSGRIRTFDESADGVVFGSGLGLVLIKRLADAIRDGNHIYAVIKGSAITNDGKGKMSYAASSAKGQIACIGNALKDAGVPAGDIGFVESHGTGTSMGDPEEVKALSIAFKAQTDQRGQCALGAVKANIGHLEAAAGIASFIKAALVVERGVIPPVAYFSKPNPRIRFENTPFFVNSTLQEWNAGGKPRRAAVNSLGVGGTNAFVILEEYVAPETVRVAQSSDPVIVPISAKSQASLNAYLRRLYEVLVDEIDVRDLAYTLQLGREAMDVRLALIVSSIADLKTQVRRYLEDGLASENNNAMAQSWVERGEADWKSLYATGSAPKRISLPTYVFAKERYWIEPEARTTANAVLHPLLHINTSDLSEQKFTSTFSGEEFFLNDHQVRTGGAVQKVLPGVAYLEMAREALDRASPDSKSRIVELRNVMWVQPIAVAEPKTVSIGLVSSDSAVDFEVYSEGETIHCQGQAIFGSNAVPAPLDLTAIRNEFRGGVSTGDELYTAFRAMGLCYGIGHQSLTRVDHGERQLLAHLKLPAAIDASQAEFVLHPSLLDGALQATIALLFDLKSVPTEPVVPFALDSVRAVAACTREMFAWIRHAPGSHGGLHKLDVDLCDVDGKVCVQLRGFTSRSLGKATRAESEGYVFAAGEWRPVPHAANTVRVEYSERIVIHARSDHRKTIDERYTDVALECFERVQSALRSRPRGKVLVQLVVPAEGDESICAGLSGLLKTARIENPQIIGQVILAPANSDVEALLAAEQSNPQDTLIKYERDVRYVFSWRAREAQHSALVKGAAFKHRGVYLITGGLGGLGKLFAREIHEHVPDARIIVTGRQPAPKTASGAIEYRQLDLEDLEAVKALVSSIGRIDGILHCAGMVADNFILKKSAAEFRRVLGPKVRGTFNLDCATQHLDLDFLALFSSLTSAVGNAGQSDYAAANGFMDQFAGHRNRLVKTGQRKGRTVAIHWPFWQEGGMQLDATGLGMLRETTGIRPMKTSTGMRAFYESLASIEDELLPMEGDLAQIRHTLETGLAVAAERDSAFVEPTVTAAVPSGASGDLLELTQNYLCRQLSTLLKLPAHKVKPRAPLEDYGIDSILALDFTRVLEQDFGSLPKTLFFEYLTIQELASYFVSTHGAKLSSLFAVQGAAPVPSPSAKGVASKRSKRRRFASGVDEVPWAEEAIAIIGLSGRYPESPNIDAFWDNLRLGKDCIVEVPPERWDWREYYSEDRTQTERHFSKWGGFIAGVDEFDPRFFNISPREAATIDPQERLFLQHCWMAVEDAGYTRERLQIPRESRLGGQVGVYAGVMYGEYNLSGNLASIANRVSYVLNLHGPSITLDTMCSSSLTAIHLACQDLKARRTDLAIAGGVNVSIHPSKYLMLSAGQFISSDGHCQSFGEGGDGYIPAEGVGVVILKRLSEAVRDGDSIYGIIRGSSVNHGGKTNGYTVPNPQAQAAVISDVLLESGVDARHVSYLEAHGTGTKLGDPIEIAALSKAFQRSTADTGFCLIGSAKSNIGHAESAAGIAGLTKVLLQMKHGQIAPSLHSQRLNPHIDFGATPFVVNQSLREWPRAVIEGREHPRIAGISSFGAGGSNAHLIVEEFVAPALEHFAPEQPVELLIPLSARTAEQLQQKIQDLLDFVIKSTLVDLKSLAFTLQTGREALAERVGLIASSLADLTRQLEICLQSDVGDREGIFRGRAGGQSDALSLVTSDSDFDATVERWIERKKLDKLLSVWVQGFNVDWRKLWSNSPPHRMSLPTYPFAKERYWNAGPHFEQKVVDGATGTARAPAIARAAAPAPEVAQAVALLAPRSALAPAVAREDGAKKIPPSAPTATREAVGMAAPMPANGFAPMRAHEAALAYSPAPDGELAGVHENATVHEAEVAPISHRAPLRNQTHLEHEASLASQATGGPSKTLSVPLSKPTGIPLVEPANLALIAQSLARPRIQLEPLERVESCVHLVDRGDGVFVLRIDAAGTDNTLDENLIEQLLDALASAELQSELKVLLIASTAERFLSGGREACDIAIERGLYRALAFFPAPVIAVVQGDSHGAGFLFAALCDFMILSREGRHSYGDLHPSGEEYQLLCERFGEAQAAQFLYLTGEMNWGSPILPRDEVAAYADKLAATLASMPRESLQLLKAHLARDISVRVETLQPAGQPYSRELTMSAPQLSGRFVRVDPLPDDALLITVSTATDGQALIDELTDVFAEIGKSDGYRSIIVVSEGGAFLEGVAADNSIHELRQQILAVPAPIIGVLDRGAQGAGWLISQYFETCIYSETSLYSLDGSSSLALEAAAIFPARFGSSLGNEIVLTGAQYSGAELKQRGAAIVVAQEDEAHAYAEDIARAWSQFSVEALKGWKQARNARVDNLSWVERADERASTAEQISEPQNIALHSEVISATAYPHGILVVTMADREARNRFSDAFIAGMNEVFRHIDESPDYKVVILTGYDTYFASGGTKEALLAIQEGRLKYTDVAVFELPLRCKLPVIAAVQGHTVGAGWSLALFSDLIACSEESIYSTRFMSFGFTPGAASTMVFPRKLGRDLSVELLMTAQEISGRDLRERGAAVPVLSRRDVLPAAMQMAEQLARRERGELIALKRQLSQFLSDHLDETYQYELDMQERTFVGQHGVLERIRSSYMQDESDSSMSVPPVIVETAQPTVETLASVTKTLAKLLADELYLAADEIEEHVQFVDLGLDSITGVTWIRKINEKYGLAIEATKVYSHPTLAELSRHVREELTKLTAESAALDVKPVTAQRIKAPQTPTGSHSITATRPTAAPQQITGQNSGATTARQPATSSLSAVATRPVTAPPVAAAQTARAITTPQPAGGNSARAVSAPRPTTASRPTTAPRAAISTAARTASIPTRRDSAAEKLPAAKAQTTPAAQNNAVPIAVVGIAGQFPMAGTPDAFWKKIAAGADCISVIPSQRWDVEAFYQEGAPAPGKTLSKWMGALENYDSFDPLFFSISPTEAEFMDPQQRLFLQACWHAIEDAGYGARSLSGSKTGVFAGCAAGDYYRDPGTHRLNAQQLMGNAPSILAARISYFLNLQGPCVSVDTACSSSLVALATACDSLCSGASDVALAGGVQVMAGPAMHIMTSQAGMLSPDGRCFTFDERANGFVPAEAVGVVMLKRLADAERDQDLIYGVIQGWGVNQDGKTNGITAPNPESQTRLQQSVYDRFRIDPEQIQLIEAHGTGTKLGDPIEIEGLKAAFGKYTQKKGYCAVGSVKSNMGHALNAAGISGFIKVLLALRHRQLPPTIHCERINQHIALKDSPFYVNSELRDWALNGAPLRQAAISSFGFSGTNCHIVVSEALTATTSATPTALTSQHGAMAIPLSARTEDQLRQRVTDLLAFIRARPADEPALLELAYTLQIGREAMDHRLGVMAHSVTQFADRLQDFLDHGDAADGCYRGQVKQNKESLLAITQDEVIKSTIIEKYLERREVDKLLQLWTKGLDVDWNKLYGEQKPRRIALPVYPFAKDRFWLEAAKGSAVIEGVRSIESHLHPLLHQNTSTFLEQRYSTKLTGSEPFLADHQVGGKKVFPGVAYLEMARAAIADAAGSESERGVTLRNVVWSRPVIIGDEPKVISIALQPQDTDEITYQVTSGDDAQEHSRGHASLGVQANSAPVDLQQLKARMSGKRVSQEQYYRTLAAIGLQYGESHRRIVELNVGKGEVLAKLSPPDSTSSLQSPYVLHPGLLDAAFHASLAVQDTDSLVARLPFALERLEILNDCNRCTWAWVRVAEGAGASSKVQRLDIDLCDDAGGVSVLVRGLSARAAEHELSDEAADSLGTLMLEPMWREQAAVPRSAAPEYGQSYLFLCGFDAIASEMRRQMPETRIISLSMTAPTLAERFHAHAVELFECLQRLIVQKPDGSALIQVLVPDRDDGDVYAGLWSLLQSAHLESSKITGQVIAIDPASSANTVRTKLEDNSLCAQTEQIRYERDRRLVRQLAEITLPAQIESSWRDSGVYLITGGAGGLGLIFAQAIVGATAHATVILTGRSELDLEGQQRIERLQTTGSHVEYRRADVTNADSVRDLIQNIQSEHGNLTGILHCAGIIRDNTLAKKSKADFEAVLAPKIAGVRHLDEETQSLDLEFFVLFSSIGGVLGGAGQADYAVANAFMDAFASNRNRLVSNGQRFGRTLSINWPLWQSDGMSVDAAKEAFFKAHFGMLAMSPSRGLEAFNRALHAEQDQIMVMDGILQRMRQRLLAAPAHVELPTPDLVTQGQTTALDGDMLLSRIQDTLRKKVSKFLKISDDELDFDTELTEFGFDSISLTEFTNILNQDLKLDLTPTVFFEFPTLASLAAHLSEARRDVFAATFTPRVTAPIAVVSAPEIREIKQRPQRFAKAAAQPVSEHEDDPIAIIGMSGKFPQAENLEAFWENLRSGRDCIEEVPASRWDWKALYGDPRTEENKTNIKWGGFIDGVEEFDSLFFGISPREAQLMDPQQRLLMTYAWKVIEDAGYAPESLSGSPLGLFVGTYTSGYQDLAAQAGVAIDGYSSTGASTSIGPNRMSFFLNVHGPSEPIETACSSSLVAIHRAVEAIQSGSCEFAIAGGVNTIINPWNHIAFSKAGMLAEDGRCKTFSAQANGYVRGEGVGMLFLKKLSAAERDGDQILAVIRSSAENHGGRASSLTAPNPKAQASLLQAAYRQARLDPRSIGYIEAHGTGTELGDPIEINALKTAFETLYMETADGGSVAATESHCGLGSLKSNIGHLELAAGVAGVIKVLLQLKHQTRVKTLHCDTVNPYIDLTDSPFYILKDNDAWPRLKDRAGRELPRRAGVSSFGFGGVNAHVVLEEYLPRTNASAMPTDVRGPALIVLSAKTEQSLKHAVEQLVRYLEEEGRATDLYSIAYTLQVGRNSMEQRLALSVSSHEELLEKLRKFLSGDDGVDVYCGEIKRSQDALAVFTGDEDLRGAVDTWIQKGKYDKLLSLWVKGLAFDWNKLYGDKKPARVSLPTYVFARDKVWIEARRETSQPARAVLHPLVHINTSSLGKQSYRTTLTGTEFFLKDHRVRFETQGSRPVLPAVAYLEMARAAVAQALPDQNGALQIHGATWLRPLAVTVAQELTIALYADEKDDSIDFEILSHAAGEETLHCQGRATPSNAARAEKHDVEQLRQRMTGRTFEAREIYSALDGMGLDYGASHRAVMTVHMGEGELLARLQLPSALEAQRDQYLLHPSLMDGALQASIGFLLSRANVPTQPWVPFALESLRIFAPCTNEMVAWIRRSETGGSAADLLLKVDLDLLDAQGNACVSLNGFTARALQAETASASFDDGLYRRIIDSVMNNELSIDSAVDLG